MIHNDSMTTTWTEILYRLPGPGGWGWGSDGQYRLQPRSVSSSGCLEHSDLQSTSSASWRSSRCRSDVETFGMAYLIPIPIQVGSIIPHIQQPTMVLIRTTHGSNIHTPNVPKCPEHRWWDHRSSNSGNFRTSSIFLLNEVSDLNTKANMSCNFARCPFDSSASKEWCHLHPDHPPGPGKA